MTKPVVAPFTFQSLELRDISLTRAGKKIVRAANLTLAPSELVVLMGPSGVGKSSLLQVISGQLSPDDGTLLLNGQDLLSLPEPLRTRLRASVMGLLGQEFALLPHLSAERNVALPLLMQNLAPAQALTRAREVLGWFELKSLAIRPAGQLSRGQQQRLALARALVTDAPLVLLDEPDASLDTQAQAQMMTRLKQLVAEGRTLLLTTHDPHLAAQADRLFRLEGGRLEALSTVPEAGQDSPLNPTDATDTHREGTA